MDKVTQILQEFASPEQVFFLNYMIPVLSFNLKVHFFATEHSHFPWALLSHNHKEFLFANTTN